MKLWNCLSKENKEKLAKLYEELTGKKYEPTQSEGRGIKCDTKIESLEEIDKLMRQPSRGAWHE